MKYEYKVVNLYVGDICDNFYTEEALDKFGKKGWELVQLLEEDTSTWRCIFMKELKKTKL